MNPLNSFGWNSDGTVNLTNPLSPHFGGGQQYISTEEIVYQREKGGVDFLVMIPIIMVAILVLVAAAAGTKNAGER